ncbi:MAG: amidohydrolase family protein [Candidatus Acidiferrales bacterium]
MEKLSLPTAAGGRKIWLRVGTLLDGVSTRPLRNAHVVYDKNAILFVAENLPPANLLNANQQHPDLDLPDYTLLPGLIDSHTHFFLEGGELNLHKRAAYLRQTPQELLQAAQTRLERLVRLGIVAVRDAGDKDGVGLALSKLYTSPRRPTMPYVDSPGAAIHRKGRYGSFMAEPLESFDSLNDCVEARVHAGADRIKLIPTGIINFKKGAVTAEPQMTAAEVSELVAAAKSFGKQGFAHASGDIGIERAIEGAVDSIEHGFFVRDDQLAKMRDRQIAWVPTFAPVQKQVDHADIVGWDEHVVSHLNRILEQHAASLLRAHQMGVQIIAGSDAGSYGVAHGTGFFYELELMQRAGLSPISIINSATGVASNRLAFKDNFGQIKSGFQSRFILTRHSPLETVSNLRKHKVVVFDGNIFESDESLDATGM